MKQKMSTADVAGEVACLRQRIIGMRLANIYDVNSKVRLPPLLVQGTGYCLQALSRDAIDCYVAAITPKIRQKVLRKVLI